MTILRGSLSTLAAQILGAASTAGLGLFIARELGASGFGAYSLALAFTMLLAPVADFGISLAAARGLATASDAGTRAGIYANAVALKLVTGVGLSVLVYVLAGPTAAAYGQAQLEPVFRAAALALLGQGLLTFFWSTLIAERRFALNLVVVVVRVVAEVALTVAAIKAGHGAAAAVLARAIAHCGAAALGFAAVFSRARDRTKPSLPAALRTARQAAGLAIVEISYGALYQVDVLMIGIFMAPLAVGLYQAPLRVLTPVTYLGIALASGLAPAVAGDGVSVRRRRHVAEVLCWLALGEAVVAAVVFARADEIMRLFGRDFAASATILRLLTPYVFVAALAPLASLLVTYLGSIRDRLVIGTTALAANAVLDLALIPRYGLTGAAVAADIAAVYYVGSHCWVVARTLELRSSMLLSVLGQAAALAALLGAGLACAHGAAGASSASWGLASLLLVAAAAVFAVRLVSPALVDRLAFARTAE